MPGPAALVLAPCCLDKRLPGQSLLQGPQESSESPRFSSFKQETHKYIEREREIYIYVYIYMYIYIDVDVDLDICRYRYMDVSINWGLLPKVV